MSGIGNLPARLTCLLLVAALASSCAGTPAGSGAAPLAIDDVSWMFPAPVTAQDIGNSIAIADVVAADGPVWSDAAFRQFIAIANGPQGAVDGSARRIGLPQQAQSIGAWRIAGIRIDAGAPGLSAAVQAQFGRSPQIRLILHPVIIDADGTPQVQDIAAHLIFNFVQTTSDPPAQPGCFARPRPDEAAFGQIVNDATDLRNRLANGTFGHRVVTAGADLGVHPGLRDPSTAAQTQAAMKAFLQRHLSAANLGAMAVMGLPDGAPAPWIFLSMLRVPGGGYVGVRGPMLDGTQFSQMLTATGSDPRVVPTPHTNNQNPITCRSGVLGPAALPIAARAGVSTADILADPSMPAPQVQHILERLQDPAQSHFFNTDCVSCHTDTRLAMQVLGVGRVPGIDQAALPNGPYNVRNFGWSPPVEGPPSRATVTRRTLAETQAVVQFINAVPAAP